MKVKDHKHFASFEYQSVDESASYNLGDIVLRYRPDMGYEIGVIIQIHGNEEYRTDKWGNTDSNEFVLADLESIEKHRYELIQHLILPLDQVQVSQHDYIIIDSRVYLINKVQSKIIELLSCDNVTHRVTYRSLNDKHRLHKNESGNNPHYYPYMESAHRFIDHFKRSLKLLQLDTHNVTKLETLSWKQPLSSQLSKLTGDGWNSRDYQNYLDPNKDTSSFEGNIVQHVSTGRLFKLPYKPDQL